MLAGPIPASVASSSQSATGEIQCRARQSGSRSAWGVAWHRPVSRDAARSTLCRGDPDGSGGRPHCGSGQAIPREKQHRRRPSHQRLIPRWMRPCAAALEPEQVHGVLLTLSPLRRAALHRARVDSSGAWAFACALQSASPAAECGTQGSKQVVCIGGSRYLACFASRRAALWPDSRVAGPLPDGGRAGAFAAGEQ